LSKIEVNTVAPQCGTTLTLGESGDTVTLGSGASQTGFGRTGTVDWQTGSIKTSTFTAANGEGYFANTAGSAFTMNLPAGSAGAIVSVADYTRTFQTNNLTIAPNGSEKIGGVANTLVANTEGQSITLVYVDGTEGWVNTAESTGESAEAPAFVSASGGTITTVDTNYKVHTFTGPGTLTINCAGNSKGNNKIDYMVVAGGGSGPATGGGDGVSGGGGAGGFRESVPSPAAWPASPIASPGGALTAPPSPIAVTVGAGGVKGTGPGGFTSGANSSFSTITSAGGGRGGRGDPSGNGQTGGSGGGAANGDSGGAGNTPPVSPAQGFAGGNAPGGAVGGGGGGATAVGVTTPGNPYGGGAGGAGATSSINGTPTARAGGGGGGSGNASPQPAGAGGAGGGAAGRTPSPNASSCGTANTGGGGGGTSDVGGGGTGGNGGSGLVIIRYKFQ